MKVPFLDIGETYKELKEEINIAIGKVLDGGWYIHGEQVKKFEQEFAVYCDASNSIGVGSGLSALELLLRGHNIAIGDEIIIPSNTFIATALAVSSSGAKPVLVEPNARTYTIDPEKIIPVITKKTKAIIAVHLYGQPANITKIKTICKEFKLLLLEDAAQAHGAEHFGKKAGTLADGSAFSFYPGKNLGAYGDGGAVIVRKKRIGEYIRSLRDYGSKEKYISLYKGTNSRLDELQAAILRVKLTHLDEWNKRREKIAQYYLKHMNNKKNNLFILPIIDDGNKHVWHLFVVQTKKRTAFMNYLTERGIGFIIHYPIPIYRQPAYKEMHHLDKNFPITNSLSDEIISLPIGPHISDEQASYICDNVNKFISTFL